MSAFQQYSVGVCYYPEHWPESIWESDLRRMLENGIHTVRVGEFAWSILEREEGKFDFSFFDRFLELCSESGMHVIFGTPSATPPAWLTKEYPEVLNSNADGVRFQHGGRRHYNYSSPVYRQKVSLFVKALAEHYGHHSAIIGWQIDNELNCETSDFLSDADTIAFREFLKNKYETLDELNQAWGTVFWSQTYTSWDQIEVPKTNAIHAHNPSLLLDYIRFVSDSAISFCEMQAKILRMYVDKNQFITTNGMFGRLDNHRMAREVLDVYTYDSYPNFAFSVDTDWTKDTMHDRMSSLALTKVRSICPHFGIMEQQSGANGWYNRMEAPMPRPGQLELWAMQSVAHGADFISFFRWRTSPIGTEIYWHGILDYDSRDNRRLREVKTFAEHLEKIQAIQGAESDAKFAVVQDYDNLFDADLDKWHARVHDLSERGLFEAAQVLHVPFDILDLRPETPLEELMKYPVLFVPHMVIATKPLVDKLAAYAEHGGKVLIGCRTGYKNEHGTCPMQPMPGLLSELTGTTVEEYSFVSPAENEIVGDLDGLSLHAECFVESLKAYPGTDVLAAYTNSYLRGDALLTKRNMGNGAVYHLGSTFSRETSLQLLSYLNLAEPYDPWLQVPPEIELMSRIKGDKRYIFLLNYLQETKTILAKVPLYSMITGETIYGEVEVAGYGVMVLQLDA